MVDVFDVWGKFSDEGLVFKPLIYHMIDVGSVSHSLWCYSISPVVREEISRYLRTDERSTTLWMSYWAGLHDLGKATPAFQAKIPEAKSALASKGYKFKPSEKPHGLMTAHLISKYFRKNQGLHLPPDLRKTISYSLGGHHGIFPDDLLLSRVNSLDSGNGNWEQVQTMLIKSLADVIGIGSCEQPSPDQGIDGTFFTILSGLTSVADWIASSETFFNFDTDETNLWKYAHESREKARKIIENLKWNSQNRLSPNRSFGEMFPFITTPYPLQEEAINLAENLGRPGLVVIEAPMGEGKTESALFLAERWSSNLRQDGIYIALPTQATADQMFTRTLNYLRGSGRGANLALLHGHAVISQEYQQIRVHGEVPDEPGYEVIAGEWFTHRKRGVLSPFGVGTIDQALLAVLPTKHFFVRLFGLAGKVVIIDEVHSYDLYMSTLLDRLLVWLKALGSSVIMLSATLPSGRRDSMLSTYNGGSFTICSQQYPRITWITGESAGCSHFRSASIPTSGRPKEIRLAWLKDEPDSIIQMVEENIAGGGNIAIICNTVVRAQSTYRFLREHISRDDVEIDLFHARYPYGQRKARQDKVLANFGKGERDPSVKRVLVATQVIEQSLDLDFDLIISEIAPIDLILQRMGRLHRHHRKERPALLAIPTLYVVEPKLDPSGAPDYGLSKLVYSEHVLLRSQFFLQQMEHIQIPSDIESLVERVYGEAELIPPTEAWAIALQRSKKELKEAMAEKESKGMARVIPIPSYERPWDATQHLLREEDPDVHQNLQAQTRDSPPTISLVCLFENGEGLSLDPEGTEIIDLSSEPSYSLIPHLLDRSVAISDRGIVRFFKDRPTPAGWVRSSLLNHHKVAIFRKVFSSLDYICQCGVKSLMLSEEVGVYMMDGDTAEI